MVENGIENGRSDGKGEWKKSTLKWVKEMG
jgi:hypothetical protein